MSYQVLARKWRPRNFSELVGQEHVRRALTNALDNNRLHHAFLFTGTRGVGKTTIARILAKSLNCEKGVTSQPCGKCNACTEISEGRFVDLIEVDAASRTKVEDTRDLLDNVQYAPTRAQYKVYLIDEVHMLSNHSFNALLKTLEEPPPHVKFLLATTDPQRLPVTILSRCLQFNLKRLPASLIQAHLDSILNKENIEFEQTAISQIATAADGSMRDALSLMDQAIAYCAEKLQSSDVSTMLGTIEQHHIYGIVNALANNDIHSILEQIEQIAEFASDFESVLVDLLSLLHNVALAQVSKQAVDGHLLQQAKFNALVDSLSPEDIQLFYQIALVGRRDFPLAPTPRAGFEMTILRMLAFQPAPMANISKPNNGSPAPQKLSTKPAPPKAGTQADKHESITAPVADSARTSDLNWEDLVTQMQLKGISLQLAKHCAIQEKTNETITLAIAESHQQLLNNNRRQEIEQAVRSLLNKSVAVKIVTLSNPGDTPAVLQQKRQSDKLVTAQKEISNDQTVKNIIDTFDAQINPNSIQPLD